MLSVDVFAGYQTTTGIISLNYLSLVSRHRPGRTLLACMKRCIPPIGSRGNFALGKAIRSFRLIPAGIIDSLPRCMAAQHPSINYIRSLQCTIRYDMLTSKAKRRYKLTRRSWKRTQVHSRCARTGPCTTREIDSKKKKRKSGVLTSHHNYVAQNTPP